ncbi:MAG: hypothetical protein K2W95_15700 [Candidatus Obscuribacterales bacterium]|nr:hypothetical protein [Candidatus Obscuribacterales bacterium]
MSLTEAQKSDARRHLEYPTIGLIRRDDGVGVFGQSAGGRYFQHFGLLEYRLQNMPPVDEARLTGCAYGALALPAGMDPLTGNQLTVTISGGGLGSPVVLVITAAAGETRVSLLQKLVVAGAQNTSLATAQIVPMAPYGGGSSGLPVQPECAFIAPNAFTLAVTGTGQIAPVITSQGVKQEPSAVVSKTSTIYGYLPILSFLEGAIAGSTRNLDTSKADVWVARRDEIDQRKKLYKEWQQRLARFMDVPVNPGSATSGGSRVVI